MEWINFWEWMNFSPISGCPITKIFPNEYFWSFIHFYGLLSFVFCVSFFFISYLYSALTLKMRTNARNVHCPFQRVLKPQLPPPHPPTPALKVSGYDCWHCTCWFACLARRGIGTDCGKLSVHLARRNLLSAIDIDVHNGFRSY